MLDKRRIECARVRTYLVATNGPDIVCRDNRHVVDRTEVAHNRRCNDRPMRPIKMLIESLSLAGCIDIAARDPDIIARHGRNCKDSHIGQ